MNKSKMVFIILTLILVTIQPISACYNYQTYSTKTTLVTGLKAPILWGTDGYGNVIFTRNVDDDYQAVSIYYPFKGTYVDLITEEYKAVINNLELDSRGNIIYVVKHVDNSCQIKKLCISYSGYRSEVLTIHSTSDGIVDIAVSSYGDVYFITTVNPWPTSIIYSINSCGGLPRLIATITGSIKHMELPKNSHYYNVLYFSVQGVPKETTKVTQVCSLNLWTGYVKVLQEKDTGTDMGKTFCYLASGPSGELYTYYREKNNLPDSPVGYLEINVFSSMALTYLKYPKTIVSQSYSNWVMFAPNWHGMWVSEKGDMFYNVNLGPSPYTNTLEWYNPRTGIIKTVVQPIGDFITVALDKVGNLYYSDSTTLYRLN